MKTEERKTASLWGITSIIVGSLVFIHELITFILFFSPTTQGFSFFSFYVGLTDIPLVFVSIFGIIASKLEKTNKKLQRAGKILNILVLVLMVLSVVTFYVWGAVLTYLSFTNH